MAAGGVQNGTQLVVTRSIQGVALAIALRCFSGHRLSNDRTRTVSQHCIFLSGSQSTSRIFVWLGDRWDPGRYSWLATSLVPLWRHHAGSLSAGIWTAVSRYRGVSGLQIILRKMRSKVDWIGALLASTFITLLSYMLAYVPHSRSTRYPLIDYYRRNISTDVRKVRTSGIAMLCICTTSLLTFIAWVEYRVRSNKPDLIPHALWKISSFSPCVGP